MRDSLPLIVIGVQDSRIYYTISQRMKIPNLHNPPNPPFNTLSQPSSALMTSLAAISLEQPLVRVMNSVDKYDDTFISQNKQ